jgi:hypothetical protein
MNSTRPAPDLLDSALLAVPETEPSTETMPDKTGLIHLRRRVPPPKWFPSWLPGGYWARVDLDQRGSWFWKQIDGRRNLLTVAGHMAREFDLSLEESRAAVVVFTKMLMLRHLIVLRTDSLPKPAP